VTPPPSPPPPPSPLEAEVRGFDLDLGLDLGLDREIDLDRVLGHEGGLGRDNEDAVALAVEDAIALAVEDAVALAVDVAVAWITAFRGPRAAARGRGGELTRNTLRCLTEGSKLLAVSY